jgi:hypothetical protein
VAGEVVNVGAGSYSYSSYLGRQGVGYIIAVKIEGGYNVKFGRTGKNLLQKDIRDNILD